MQSSDTLNFGYLKFHPKSGKSPQKYSLHVGVNTIGTSLSSNIRIKTKNQDAESVSCVIDVKDSGLAILENKGMHPVIYNGTKMNKIQMLKNNDIFTIAGKEFHYINDSILSTNIRDAIKKKKRQSVMPSFKIKAVSQLPVPTRSVSMRRSLSAQKIKRQSLRRSCSSALPDKKRNNMYEWETTETPIFTAKSIQPSTSMKKVTNLSVSVRKSLFLKNKGNISMDNLMKSGRNSVTSILTTDDSFPSHFVDDGKTPTPRGMKRNHENSNDNIIQPNKRRKRNDDRLVLRLSISHSSVQDSPLATTLYELLNDSSAQKSPLNNLTDVRGVKKLSQTPEVQKSLLNDLTVKGVKKNVSTPKIQNSPLNDLNDVRGVKKILKTPKLQKSPLNDLTNVRGVKKLLKTPKLQKSPLKLLNTPKVQKSPLNDLSDIKGVKKLMKTPKVQKLPLNDLTDVRGVKKIFTTPRLLIKLNDLTNVGGIKKMMAIPKVQKSPLNDLTDVRGVKKFLRTPKIQKSPLNDLTDLRGVKKILKTPKTQKSPRNDLTDVKGIKQIFRTPKEQKSPVNDLSDVRGVRRLLRNRQVQKSPLNDLTNVGEIKTLFKSPKVQKSPKNDLSDVKGIKKLMRSPVVQKEPLNDLTDVEGVKELMSTPKIDQSLNIALEEVYNDLLHSLGVHNSTAIKALKSPKEEGEFE
ncbi:GPI-anchored adhesin-like protein PGA55 [Asbolus verrucosus]|uniref:GPI-anchored adhesin-like protein PGA55 n=1 Tax=Asbolus verrucosus TaxID=1661398 RepID=A0A482VI05_ASBVE|nr:GPI-anchored adhesin-like protein PGA55 [Asbolus verrucosus]